MIHTDFRKGTKLWIIFKDGRTIKDKFLESKSGLIICEKQRYSTSLLRSVTIWRNRAGARRGNA